MFHLFQAALAFLFAATLLLPGDAILQTGGGFLIACLWLLLTAAWLLLRNFRFPTPSQPSPTGRQRNGRSDKSSRNKNKENVLPKPVENPRSGIQQALQRKASAPFEKCKRPRDGAPPPGKTPPTYIPLRWGTPDCLLLFFLFLYLLVSPLARPSNNTFIAANIATAWTSAAAAWFLFRQLLRDRRTVFAFVLVLISVTLAESSLALYQEYVANPRLLAEYRADPDAMLRAEGLPTDADSQQRRLIEARLFSATPVGTYLLSNTLAGQLLPGCVFACSLLLGTFTQTKREPGEGRGRYTYTLIIAAFAAALILFAIALTRCRSAALALFCTAITVPTVRFLFIPETRAKLRAMFGSRRILCAAGTVLLGLTVVLAVFAAKGSDTGILAGARRSLGFRLEYWGATAAMIADHPLRGVGIGNFQTAYMRYKYPTASEEILDPHNFLMELLALGGIPATLLFLLFTTSALFPVRKTLPGTPRPREDDRDCGSPDSAQDAGPLRMLGAGLLGALFAVPATFPDRSPLPWGILLAAPLAFALVSLAVPHIRAKISSRSDAAFPLSRAAHAAAIFALLLHLLAAGGISYISTLTLLLFLLATAAPRRFDEPATLPRRDALLSRVLAIPVLAIFCTVYYAVTLPTANAWIIVQRAGEFPPHLPARAHILDAARDRLFFIPYEFQTQLLDAKFLAWTLRRDEDARRALADELLRTENLAPDAPGMLLRILAVYETLEQATTDPSEKLKIREKMRELARRAVRAYPNDAKPHAVRARLLERFGERDEAIRERNEAIRLDDITPHADRKLPRAQRESLERMTPPSPSPATN